MRFAACTAILCIAVAVRAEEPKPNTLTPKEIANGWMLLFDGETTFGWRIEGEGKVENGALVLGGAKATVAETSTTLDWQRAMAVSMETRWEGKESPTFLFMGDMMGLTDTSKTKFVGAVTRNGGRR